MEDAVRLIELLQQAAEWNDEEASIYATQPWSCDAEAVFVTPSPNTMEPIRRGETSYDYFLEAIIAREFIEDYAASGEGGAASNWQRCERLIRYAQSDA